MSKPSKLDKLKKVFGWVEKGANAAHKAGVPYAGLVGSLAGLAKGKVKEIHENPELTPDEKAANADAVQSEVLIDHEERMQVIERALKLR